MYCPYNQALDCMDRSDSKDTKPCEKCGWNPDVDQERRKKTREMLAKGVTNGKLETD